MRLDIIILLYARKRINYTTLHAHPLSRYFYSIIYIWHLAVRMKALVITAFI